MQAKEADTPVDPTIVTADNTFGLNLLNTLIAGILPGFYVNVAEHKTYVQVDESGTVAAAATGVGETSVVSLSVNLQVNHPFFYAIRDNQTGELLFVGVLMNPSAG
jgi:serine protease inhibitor